MQILEHIPQLMTPHLILRSFTMQDAPTTQMLCNDPDIHANTLNLPFPYTLADAEWWIATHPKNLETQTEVNYALVARHSNELVGTIGLMIKQRNNNAEMGYWIGKPYWNKGYATEGAAAVLKFGFEVLNLHKIYARYHENNLSSGRVMQKIGLLYEGFSPEQIYKNKQYIGLYHYGATRQIWENYTAK